MTPQEQELVNELFHRLAHLENNLRRAPDRGWTERGAARNLRARADGVGSR